MIRISNARFNTVHSARATGLGLGNWDTPHLERYNASRGELGATAVFIVVFVATVLLTCSWIRDFSNDIDDKIAISTPAAKKVNWSRKRVNPTMRNTPKVSPAERSKHGLQKPYP